MANLIIAGAAGRMGRMLIALAARDSGHKIVGAVEARGMDTVGSDAGATAGIGSIGVRISDDYGAVARPGTVTLDFTNAAASLEHLEAAVKNDSAIVIGSTGFSADQERRAREIAPRIRTVIAPNMSVGINVLMKLAEQVAAILPDFDAEIVEIHHRTKVDAPSGTALGLGRAIAAARGIDLVSNAVHGREGITGVRPANSIAMMALRAGDAVGDHTVIFGGPGERLELIHRAQSREGLARGALRAAAWLENQPPGLYTMRDVLNL